MVERQESRMGRRKVALPKGKDKLDAMYERQEAFVKTFGVSRNMPPADISRWVKEFCLCSVAEQVELLEEVNWKHWKTAKKEIDIEAARFEVVDALKFLMGQAVALGMTADDLYRYDQRKAEINEKRQKDKY